MATVTALKYQKHNSDRLNVYLDGSGAYSSIGWGAIDQKLAERSLESITQFDISTTLQLGKFLGERAGVQIPFYYQYSQTIRKPKYDALDLDLLLKEKLQSIDDQEVRDSVKAISQDFTSLRQLSVTNVRKNPRQGGRPMPWDISNFSGSYSFSRARMRNEVLEKDQLDQHRAGLDYAYSIPLKPLEPFKNVSKSSWMKWLTDINLMPLPNNFTFSTVMDRKFGERSYRFSDEIFKTWFDKRFTWDRVYNLRWDLTRSLKLNYSATNSSVVDEPNEYVDRANGILIDPSVRRDSIWTNIKKGGRTKDFAHQIRGTFSVPTKSFPFLDWTRADVTYDGTYGWKAAALNTDSLGNVIQNGQNIQMSAELDFLKLYNKSKALAKINKSGGTTTQKQDPRSPAGGPGGKDKTKSDPAQQQPPPGGADPDKGATAKKEEKKSGEISPVLKPLLRLTMMIRKFRINYGENNFTSIPGYVPSSRMLGMSPGFEAPGWSFISGIQPRINRRADQETGDYLDEARSSGWITTNAFQNLPVLQGKTRTLDSRISVEPFTDFKIEMDFTRSLTQNFSVFFKTYEKGATSIEDIARRSPMEMGSFSISYFSVPTLFMGDSLEVNQLFTKFENNRAIISQLRGDSTHAIDGTQYAQGFGRKQQDVLVPAFLAAYTNKDPENFEFTDMFNWIPRPNWTVNYNGLSKLPWFRDIFTNVRITHGYKNTLTINQFQSVLNYDDYDENTGQIVGQRNPANLDTITQNYYSRYLMPSVIIEEQFAPLLGIDVKMRNGMGFSFGYAKRRGLAMGFVSYELAETRSTTVDFGFEWVIKDARLGFLPGFNSQANKNRPTRSGQQATGKQGNDLSILFDFSLADNFTINHLLDQQIGARPTRGSKDVTISPSLSYDVNKNVNLRFFVDYRRQSPYVSNAYVVVSTQGGVTVRVSLN